ncbi:MAG: hypothetical protein ACP5RT_00055 [Candidatus Micrarchaeia archaeon]
MIIEIAMLFAVAFFTLGSAFFIFASKSIFHAAIALAFTFFGSAMALLFASQSILALLQLFVLVGGFSTYLIIAFSQENKEKRSVNMVYFSVLAIVIAVSFALMFMPIGGSTTHTSNGFLASFESLEENTPYLLYVIAFIPFAGAIGSILLVKKRVIK